MVARLRFPLMALGMLGLVAAMWGGLMRLGLDSPPSAPPSPVLTVPSWWAASSVQ